MIKKTKTSKSLFIPQTLFSAAMALFLIAIFLTTAAIAPQSALARSESIAAVVNDQAITSSDLAARLKLIMASSRMPDTSEVREKLRPQVLDILIDEKIRMQEANKLGIKISDAEIDQALETVAQRNKLSKDQFLAAMQHDGVSPRTMRQQIEAQLAWNGVIQQKIRPKIEITDKQIDDMLSRLSSRIGTEEYFVGEIFLPVENQKDESRVRQLAQKLYTQITQGGAPFGPVAAQFSQGANAAQGGMIGWVQAGQLPEELDKKLKSMPNGAVSTPIRSLTGYHILYLRDKREISENTLPSRDQILNKLGLDEMERRQRRFFLDLKSEAFIDKRV